MWSNLVFVFQSTTPFMAISMAILLAITIYVAKKHPVKLHATGSLTLAFGLLCFAVSLTAVFDTYMVYGEPISDLYELFQSQDSISIQDFNQHLHTNWGHMVAPLRKSCATLLWTFLVYLVSEILYIIRTPRI